MLKEVDKYVDPAMEMVMNVLSYLQFVVQSDEVAAVILQLYNALDSVVDHASLITDLDNILGDVIDQLEGAIAKVDDTLRPFADAVQPALATLSSWLAIANDSIQQADQLLDLQTWFGADAITGVTQALTRVGASGAGFDASISSLLQHSGATALVEDLKSRARSLANSYEALLVAAGTSTSQAVSDSLAPLEAALRTLNIEITALTTANDLAAPALPQSLLDALEDATSLTLAFRDVVMSVSDQMDSLVCMEQWYTTDAAELLAPKGPIDDAVSTARAALEAADSAHGANYEAVANKLGMTTVASESMQAVMAVWDEANNTMAAATDELTAKATQAAEAFATASSGALGAVMPTAEELAQVDATFASLASAALSWGNQVTDITVGALTTARDLVAGAEQWVGASLGPKAASIHKQVQALLSLLPNNDVAWEGPHTGFMADLRVAVVPATNALSHALRDLTMCTMAADSAVRQAQRDAQQALHLADGAVDAATLGAKGRQVLNLVNAFGAGIDRVATDVGDATAACSDASSAIHSALEQLVTVAATVGTISAEAPQPLRDVNQAFIRFADAVPDVVLSIAEQELPAIATALTAMPTAVRSLQQAAVEAFASWNTAALAADAVEAMSGFRVDVASAVSDAVAVITAGHLDSPLAASRGILGDAAEAVTDACKRVEVVASAVQTYATRLSGATKADATLAAIAALVESHDDMSTPVAVLEWTTALSAFVTEFGALDSSSRRLAANPEASDECQCRLHGPVTGNATADNPADTALVTRLLGLVSSHYTRMIEDRGLAWALQLYMDQVKFYIARAKLVTIDGETKRRVQPNPKLTNDSPALAYLCSAGNGVGPGWLDMTQGEGATANIVRRGSSFNPLELPVGVTIQDANDGWRHGYVDTRTARALDSTGRTYQAWVRRDAASTSTSTRSPIDINDGSKPDGQYAYPHKGHTVGQELDGRLARLDGGILPKMEWDNTAYDAAAMEAQVIAMRENQFNVIFNDPLLVAKKLTTKLAGHDDHWHARYHPGASPSRCDISRSADKVLCAPHRCFDQVPCLHALQCHAQGWPSLLRQRPPRLQQL